MMNKEKINLLKMQLVLNYYKKDITDRYVRYIDNIVLDNKVLNSMDERLYITTLDKHNDLQQRIDKVNQIIDECLMLMPHEFSWEEQIEYIREILGGKECQ